MGNWKLEISKMALYMSFPVVLFYVFNQPKYFEEWTVRKRRELYPPLDKMHSQVLGLDSDKSKELFDALCILNIKLIQYVIWIFCNYTIGESWKLSNYVDIKVFT